MLRGSQSAKVCESHGRTSAPSRWYRAASAQHASTCGINAGGSASVGTLDGRNPIVVSDASRGPTSAEARDSAKMPAGARALAGA